MKTLFSLFFLFVLSFSVFGQNSNNLIFFSEDGSPFTVYLNGNQINPQPQTNIKINNVGSSLYQVRIVMQNTGEEIYQKIFPQEGNETVLSVRRNKKGRFILKYRAAVEVLSNVLQGLYYYNSQIVKDIKKELINDVVYNDVVYDNPQNENENAADNTGGETDKISNREFYDDVYNNVPNNRNRNNNNTNNYDYNDNTNNNKKNNNVVEEEDRACPKAMNEYDFSIAYKNLEKQIFNEGKKLVAKQLIESNCLTTNQIIKILNNFKMEPDRLELAKISYTHTWDRKNFVNVFSVLKQPNSISELQSIMK